MKTKMKTPLFWRMSNRKEKEELVVACVLRDVVKGHLSPEMAMQEVRELQLIPQRRKEQLLRKLSAMPNRFKQ